MTRREWQSWYNETKSGSGEERALLLLYDAMEALYAFIKPRTSLDAALYDAQVLAEDWDK